MLEASAFPQLTDQIDWAKVDLLALLNAMPFGMAILDQNLRHIFCNPALAAMDGVSVADHLGRSVSELFPDHVPADDPALRAALETAQPVQNVRLTHFPGAGEEERRWIETMIPLTTVDGMVRHVLVSIQEITPLEQAREQLQSIRDRFRLFQELTPDAFTVLVAIRDESGEIVDFRWEYANPAALRTAEVVIGARVSAIIPKRWKQDFLFPRYKRLVEQGASDSRDGSVQLDGASLWYNSTAVAIDEDRIAIRWRDITAEKRAQEQLQTVSHEYRHRLKNQLSIAQSLINHAGRVSASKTEMVARLDTQLQALGAAQNLLIDPACKSVDLEQLLSGTLQPFLLSSTTLRPGPPVSVDARYVVPLVLAINEIATNSTKYGSLKKASGTAEIGWKITEGRVIINWIESPHRAPRRATKGEGFGSSLFRMLERTLPDARVEFEQNGKGFRATIGFALPDA